MSFTNILFACIWKKSFEAHKEFLLGTRKNRVLLETKCNSLFQPKVIKP